MKTTLRIVIPALAVSASLLLSSCSQPTDKRETTTAWRTIALQGTKATIEMPDSVDESPGRRLYAAKRGMCSYEVHLEDLESDFFSFRSRRSIPRAKTPGVS